MKFIWSQISQSIKDLWTIDFFRESNIKLRQDLKQLSYI